MAITLEQALNPAEPETSAPLPVVDQDSINSFFVIKRDNSKERFSLDKIKNICNWATNGDENFTHKILSSFTPKLYNSIKTKDVFDLLIRTSANQINPMYSEFEYIAARFLLLKMYKETWIKKIHDGKLNYPDLSSVIKKGISCGRYDPALFNQYSAEEIEDLGNYIKQERDYLFTYKALYFFFDDGL